MKKAISLILALFLVFSILSGCAKNTSSSTSASTTKASTAVSTSTTTSAGPSATSSSLTTSAATKKPQGSLVIAVPSLGNEQWLPDLGDSIANNYTISNEMLLDRKPGSDEPIPWLADTWNMSPDGKTWTFNLHKGIQFQGGYGELTADDVKYSYDLTVSKESSSGVKSFFASNVESVEVVNPYQVVFHMKAPNWQLVYQVSANPYYFRIVSKKYVEAVGTAQAAMKPIGTGAWKFVEYKSGDHVTFQADATNWRQVPYYDTVTIKVVPEESTRMAMVQSGNADMALISEDSIATAQKANLTVHTLKDVIGYQVYFGDMMLPSRAAYNPNLPWVGPDPVKALKVRQAMNLAVDKQSIITNLLHGYGSPLAVPHYFPGMPATDPNWKQYAYDPAKAKQLLAEAGYPNGFSMDLGYHIAVAPENQAVAEAVGLYLGQVGIQAKIVPIQYATFKPIVSARQNLTSFVYGGSRSAEPIIFTSLLWGSDSSICYGPEDPTGKLESMQKAANAEMDPAKRAKLEMALGQYYYDNYWAIPVATSGSFWVSDKKVGHWPGLPLPYATNLEFVTP